MNTVTLMMVVLLIFSCARRVEKAVSSAKYSAFELVGLEKRDLFKREVAQVKEEQEETGEAFKDALTELREIYQFEGGNLERQHDKFRSSYENANEEANELKARVAKVDKIANDLFGEWETELEEIGDKELRAMSSSKLRETKKKYGELERQLKKSERKMDPVLSRLKDQVLFLKHNLNAKAIAGLKTESGKIQRDIEALIKEVEASSKEADQFIKTAPF